MSQQLAAAIHGLEYNTKIPAWRCEAVRRSNLKRVTFWLRGSQIVTPEQARMVAAMAFAHLDCSPSVFKCERREGEQPPVNREAVPVDWFLHGTTRMKEEIDAGLRPFSEYLLPPIQVPQRPQSVLRAGVAKPGRSILRP